MTRIAPLLLVLSGIASLTYQVAWVRLLGTSMGSSSAAVGTVTAVFFLGLGLGSALAQRTLPKLAAPGRRYLTLEAAIGVWGLLSLPAFLHLSHLVAAVPAIGSNLVLRFCAACAILIVPTCCMGATFPVMARVLIRKDAQLGARLSELYAFNTLGAVVGALGCGFVFIPLVGLDGAIGVAAGLNAAVVGVGAVALRRADRGGNPSESDVGVLLDGGQDETSPPPHGGDPRRREDPPSSRRRQRRALAVLVATGFIGIAAEIAWTRYLVMFVETTIYGYAAVLGIYLLGLVLGSWFVRKRLDDLGSPERAMAVGLALLGLALLLTRSGFSLVPHAVTTLEALGWSGWAHVLARYGVTLVLLLPCTFLFGALFPLTLQTYCGSVAGVRARVGGAYAANTLASIAGSLVAAFVWIPTWGTDHLLVTSGLVTVALASTFHADLRRTQAAKFVAASSVAALCAVAMLPALEVQALVAEVRLDVHAVEEQEVLFVREGRTGVISVATGSDGQANLYNNGLNEATIEVAGPHPGTVAESLLGLLPALLHPHPRSAFVVGLGGGVTARTLLRAGLPSVRVVELEPVVAEALSTTVGPAAAGLQHPNLELIFDDARNALLVDDRRYDLIVSQPSHPWRAGAANLFTREFFELASSRLEAGGVHAQWLNLFRMDTSTLLAILGSFVDVYPYSLCFVARQNLILLGSTEETRFQSSRADELFSRLDLQAVWRSTRVDSPGKLFALFALSAKEIDELTRGHERSTDTNLLPEVRLSRLTERPHGPEDPLRFLRAQATLDVVDHVDPKRATDWLYAAGRELARRRQIATLRDASARLRPLDERRASQLASLRKR